MNGLLLTVLGFSIIFIATTAGAALVFFFKKKISAKINSIILGFSAGIMIAASIWSLLLPALEEASEYGVLSFVPATIGVIVGGFFLSLTDKIKLPDLSGNFNIKNDVARKSLKMFLAITVHNIPEGLAVGFAFGWAAMDGDVNSFLIALGLATGIAIQNFPEGAAVSLPIKSATGNRSKAFLYGVLSGIVEPIAAIIGYFLASTFSVTQPWLLSFAAGAMIFVVVDDIVPDTKLKNSSHLGAWGFVIGFIVMMALDVAFG